MPHRSLLKQESLLKLHNREKAVEEWEDYIAVLG
jgi:hypothetical protein